MIVLQHDSLDFVKHAEFLNPSFPANYLFPNRPIRCSVCRSARLRFPQRAAGWSALLRTAETGVRPFAGGQVKSQGLRHFLQAFRRCVCVCMWIVCVAIEAYRSTVDISMDWKNIHHRLGARTIWNATPKPPEIPEDSATQLGGEP